jgi:hypothetical protein
MLVSSAPLGVGWAHSEAQLPRRICAGRDGFLVERVKVRVEQIGVDIAAVTKAGSATVRLLSLVRLATTVSPSTSTALRWSRCAGTLPAGSTIQAGCPSPASAVWEVRGG